ncbi:MAG: DNA helicase-2/ATP-dependent DNA helicase PcrA [Rhodothermales bacterium]|jgi:DNA helicase-2/ATP-dependent DNA helicase PcrA
MDDFFRILMHHRLAGLLRDKPPVFRGELQRTLEYLQFGYWGNGTRVKLLKGVRKAVYEARINRSLRLLFTVVRTHASEPPYDLQRYLLAWDIVDHDHIDRAKRMNIVPETGFLDFEEQSSRELDGVPEQPELRDDEPRMEFREVLTDSVRWYELDPDVIADEHEWQALLDDPSVRDLELKLSREQAETVFATGPVLLRGTAGSGKTTVSVYRLARVVAEQPGARVLYVTYSEPLLATVRQLFGDLFRARREELPAALPVFLTFPELYGRICGESPRDVLRYAEFAYWYRMVQGGTDAALAWEEIRGIIKGGCLDPGKPHLSQAEYEALGRKRAPIFVDRRPHIFQVFRQYQEWTRKQGLVDDIDLARLATRRLKSEHRFTHIVCDEGQDLTELELGLLLSMLEHPSGLFFAADPQQVVNPSGFRWAELRSLFRARHKSLPKPEIQALTRNYRSVQSIVALANALVTLKRERTGRSDDDDLQDTTLHGATPVLVQGEAEEVLGFLKGFGPRCAIITGTAQARAAVARAVGSERVFDIQEAKGLEFDACVLWHVLEPDCGLWQRLLESDEPMKEDPVARRAIHHAYVAVTRARRYLGIYEGSEASTALWRSPQLKAHVEQDEAVALSKFMLHAASPEAWGEEGEYFLARGRFRQAAECFRRAGMGRKEEESMAGHHESIGDYRGAADLYRSLDLPGKAAPCLERLGVHGDAAALFAKFAAWADAGRCYEVAKMHAQAADAWEKAGDEDRRRQCLLRHFEKHRMWKDAAQLALKMGDEAGAIRYFERAGMKKRALELRISQAQNDDVAELLLKAGRLEEAGKAFLEAGDSVRGNECLAKVSERRGNFAAAAEHWRLAGDTTRALRFEAKGLEQEGKLIAAGLAYSDLGRLGSAINCFEREGTEEGENWKLAFQSAAQGQHFRAATIFESLGEWQRALTSLDKYPSEDVKLDMLRTRCNMRRLWKEGDVRGALALGDVFSDSPTMALAGEICEDSGKWREAAGAFAGAFEWERALSACDAMGSETERERVLAAKAEHEENDLLAADHWEKAGLMQKAARLRGKAYEKAGDMKSAAEWYEKGKCAAKARKCRKGLLEADAPPQDPIG